VNASAAGVAKLGAAEACWNGVEGQAKGFGLGGHAGGGGGDANTALVDLPGVGGLGDVNWFLGLLPGGFLAGED
jgi:hypothetical protein